MRKALAVGALICAVLAPLVTFPPLLAVAVILLAISDLV